MASFCSYRYTGKGRAAGYFLSPDLIVAIAWAEQFHPHFSEFRAANLLPQ